MFSSYPSVGESPQLIAPEKRALPSSFASVTSSCGSMYHHVHNKLWRLVVILPLVAGACGPRSDTSAADGDDATATPPASAVSAGSAAAEAPGSPVANAPPDSDRHFLRAMSDNEWGLLVLSHEALEHDSGEAVHAEAVELDKSHGEEMDRLYAALRGIFHDDYTGKLTAEDSVGIDSLAKLGGTTYDQAFRRAVIAQLQQSVALTDRYLPTLRGAEVRTLAERLRAMHQRDIESLEKR